MFICSIIFYFPFMFLFFCLFVSCFVSAAVEICSFRSQEIDDGGRQGWLTKRKGDKDMWDPKYVVLTADSLRYFSPKMKVNLRHSFVYSL